MEIEIKESAGPYIGPKSGVLKIKTIEVAGTHFRTDQNRKRLELGKAVFFSKGYNLYNPLQQFRSILYFRTDLARL